MTMRAFLTLAFALALTAPVVAQDLAGLSERDRKSVEDFQRLAESSSLRWDDEAIRAFARLDGDFVVPGLLKAYATDRPRYAAELRSLLAAALGRRRRPSDSDRAALRGFARRAAKSPEHGWVLFQAQSLLARFPEERQGLRQIVTGDRQAWRRMAALYALSASGDRGWGLDLEPWIASALELREPERGLMLNALAWSVAERAPSMDASLLDLIVELRDHEALTRRTRLHIGYALDHALGRREGEEAREPTDTDTVERPGRFMSIEADGERILFVLDASDSMLQPLSVAERRAFEELLDPEARRAQAGLIRTMRSRFDAARVHLILALLSLRGHQRFAIITFGERAELWPGTPGFIKASKAARRRVATSLKRGLRPGTVVRSGEAGLMGSTNLYRALQLAFRVGSRGPVATPRPELDPGLMRGGADMMFLLSDGLPIKDELAGDTPELETIYNFARGKETGRFREQEVVTRDPETGAVVRRETQRVPILEPAPEKLRAVRERRRYTDGPFVSARHYRHGSEAIRDELRRLNLFRRVIVHAIAFGEADAGLMKSLAKQEHGRFLQVSR